MVSTVSSGLAFARTPSKPKASEPSLGRPANYHSSDPRNQRPNLATAFSARGAIGPHILRQTGGGSGRKKSAPKLLCEGRRIAGGTDGSAASVRSAEKALPSQRWEVGRISSNPPTDYVTAAKRLSNAASASSVVKDEHDTGKDKTMNVRGTSLSVQPQPSHGTNASIKSSKKPATRGTPVSVLSPRVKSSLDSAVWRPTPNRETGHGWPLRMHCAMPEMCNNAKLRLKHF